MFCHVMVVEQMGVRSPDEAEWLKIRQNIKKIIDHPVWKASVQRDQRMEAVQLALSKNQDRDKAFTKVYLDLPYLILPKSTQFKEYWEKSG